MPRVVVRFLHSVQAWDSAFGGWGQKRLLKAQTGRLPPSPAWPHLSCGSRCPCRRSLGGVGVVPASPLWRLLDKRVVGLAVPDDIPGSGLPQTGQGSPPPTGEVCPSAGQRVEPGLAPVGPSEAVDFGSRGSVRAGTSQLAVGCARPIVRVLGGRVAGPMVSLTGFLWAGQARPGLMCRQGLVTPQPSSA